MFNDPADGSDHLILFDKPIIRTGGMGDGLTQGGPNISARQADGKELDSMRLQNLHGQLWSFFLHETERQAENRREMALDEEFYDNNQWTEEDKATLKARGQEPLVYNVIGPTINWLIGTERRGRTDFKVLPRKKTGSRAAERKTQLLKYLSDVHSSEFSKSRAFQDATKVGVGWLEVGAQDTVDGEPVYDRYESWRNMLWDSTAQELDLSDARFMARHKWMDADNAIAMKKERGATIRAAILSSDNGPLDELGDEHMDAIEDYYSDGLSVHAQQFFGIHRPRVRVIEMWFTLPVETERLSGGDFSGEVFDQYSPGHVETLRNGEAELVKSVYSRMHVAIMTSEGFIHLSESPYRHNRYPFTPVWCYRRGKNGLPYGVIRGLRDIQSDINKRASKALHILSTNKVIMERGAVDDLDAFEEEVSRPDAIIVVNDGKRLDLNVDRDLAPAHLDLMSRSIAMIQQASGVTDESLGRTTNAVSGKAITARQDQGALATAALFDNYRLACKLHGEKQLSLIEQFFSEKKSFRITNSRGVPQFIDINDGLPENDIIRTKADFIISEDDWRASWREAQVQTLLQAIQQVGMPPELFMGILDLLIEMMDVPYKDEIVARIRKVTKMKDPDADPNEPPTPEELAEAEADAAAAEMQRRGAEAEIAKVEAEAALKAAQAAKAGAEVRKVIAGIAGDNVAAQKAALEAALALLSAPAVADVADSILQSAGFEGSDMPAPPPAAPPPAAMMPPPGAQPGPQPRFIQ